MLVFVVIPHELYGFGSDDPIVFETKDEMDEFIKCSRRANELAGHNVGYKTHICHVQSSRKRAEARQRFEKRNEE